jgi:chromosome partitioning protein
MRILAVVGRKGGSGKTTIAMHMALAAHLRGHRTILADADPQRSASSLLRHRVIPGPQRIETAGSKLFTLKIEALKTGADTLVIDTPAGPEGDITYAVSMADLALIVVRPTCIDLAASVRSIEMVQRLRCPAMIVLSQAPPARGGIEPPAVQNALDALRFTNLDIAPTIVRSREAYQAALVHGCSAEELAPSSAAGREAAALWADLQPAEAALLRA